MGHLNPKIEQIVAGAPAVTASADRQRPKFRSLLPAVICFLLSLASASPAIAAAAKYPMSYSGRLVDELGAPLDGPVDLAIQFYRQEQDSVGLLGEALLHPRTELSAGVFQVELDLSDAEINTLFADSSLQVWIEVRKKDADARYRPLPRQRFNYVPYALHALSADSVPVDDTTVGFDPTTGKLRLLTNAWGSPSVGKFLTTNGSGGLMWGTPMGSGDMLKSSYDTNANGKVDSADNAEQLGGQAASYYSNAANLTGTLAYARLPVGITATLSLPVMMLALAMHVRRVVQRAVI